VNMICMFLVYFGKEKIRKNLVRLSFLKNFK
jgi:hypothetical protein